LPDLDDEFASEVSDFDTYQDYHEDIRKNIQETMETEATEAAKQSMLQAVVLDAEIALPDPMVEDKLDEMMEQMSWRMRQQGLTMKDYLRITRQSAEEMRDTYREQAKNALLTDLVLEQIVKEEDIQPNEKDVEEMLADYAAAMGKDLESLELSEGQKSYFEHRSKIKGAIDLMWANAKVTDEFAPHFSEDDGQNEKA